MDPLSQASIGAAAAQALSRRTNLRTALWVGALGGFLPDADILIRSSEDPLLSLEYHRHFTHALVFIPLVAAASERRMIRLESRPTQQRQRVKPLFFESARHRYLGEALS